MIENRVLGSGASFYVTVFFVFVASDVDCYGQSDKNSVARIQAVGGTVLRNKAGEVETIILVSFPGASDEDCESINFGVFPQLKRLIMASSKMTDRSLAHLGSISSELDSVDIVGANMTEQGLVKFLKKQQSITHLHLVSAWVSGKSLAAVAKLRNLESFALSGRPLYRPVIEAKDLKELTKLKDLRELDLDRTTLSDAGVCEIKKLSSLTDLSISGTRITDASVQELSALTDLWRLNVSSTAISDKALHHLSKFTSLRYVDLSYTGITDNGLADIAKLTNLRELRLNGAKITDSGILTLAPLVNLRRVFVDSTKVTKDGEKNLGLLLPGLKFVR